MIVTSLRTRKQFLWSVIAKLQEPITAASELLLGDGDRC